MPWRDKSEKIELELITHHETDRAWLVSVDEDSEEVWLPKSLGITRDGTTYSDIPQWIAEEKGLI